MKTTLITLCFFLNGIAFTQLAVNYMYDDAGNRIKREPLGLTSDPSGFVAEEDSITSLKYTGVSLTAFPNPATDHTVVAVLLDTETISATDQEALEKGVVMQLADVNGRVLSTSKVGALEQEISLQGCAKGIYFVKVFTENGQLVGDRKVLKE